MNRIVIGALAALLLVGAGLFWWQGRAATEHGAPPPAQTVAAGPTEEALPFADAKGLHGAAPPEADELTKEQKRFDRLDHDRDGRVTANEMLAPRAAAFRKLDVDHNNLLTFQEWSVRTATKFSSADANHDGWLSREEFATTKVKAKHPTCRCSPVPHARRAAKGSVNADDSGGDEGADPDQ